MTERAGLSALLHPALLALAISAVAALSLLGAYFFEHVLDLLPCPLCLQQRYAYYLAVPLATLVAWAAAAGWPVGLPRAGFVLLAAAFLANAALGIYHAGAEWKFWAGPTDCAARPLPLKLDAGSLMQQMQQTVIVRCDEAAWRFAGLSLAGWSVLISLGLVVLAVTGLVSRRGYGSSSVSQ
jgi:disulfide bond formation protein DsbB